MLSYENNIRAILESNLTEIKDEILDTIVENILKLKEDSKTDAPFLYGLSTEDLNNMRIMGYTASDLIILAERLKDNDVDFITVRDYADGVRYGYERANADMERALKDSISRFLDESKGANNV